ncbi:MAG: PspC family transcriptional regulator [Cyclobacteriaceae bacterium]|nr:PspC family transcriptional regulator [Cyclobacteriaceae bacterium]
MFTNFKKLHVSLANKIEVYSFGVCTKLGEKLKLPISSIRIFFIYASFITFGSPIILYMGLVFLMNFRQHLRRKTNRFWYT